MITLIILLSGVQLALENPLNGGKLKNTLYYIDISTTFVFIVEFVLKVIAYGFLFNGPNSYLRSKWNLVDFVIIGFSMAAISPISNRFKIIKTLRVARILKIISYSEGMQLAVNALIAAIPQIISITAVTIMVFLFFGVICISYFKGKFYTCDSSYINFDMSSLLIETKWDCLNTGGYWHNSNYSFDNIASAMKTLFRIASTSSWAAIMYQSTFITEVDYVPATDSMTNTFWIYYFIIFMVVCSFFILNLFVGVVISSFNREKERIGGNHLLTKRQKEWIETKLTALKTKPLIIVKPPKNVFRYWIYRFQKNVWFERFISICIAMNTTLLLLVWYQEPSSISNITD